MSSDGRQFGEDGIDEVVARAARQYRQHLELIYPFLGFGLVSLLLEFRFDLLWELFDIDPGVGVTADPTPIRDLFSDPLTDAITPVLEELFVLFVLGVLSLFLITLVVFLLAAGIAFLAVADERSGVDRKQTSRAIVAFRRLPALFVASVIGAMLITAGTVLFVVPGLYLAAKFALGGPAIVIDGHGPIAGLKASWRRSSGQLFGVGVVAIGGAVVVSLVGFVPLVGEVIALLVLLPVVLLALAELYLESPPAEANQH